VEKYLNISSQKETFMFDVPKLKERWQISKPSVTQVMATALALSLIFSGYLVARSDVRAVLFSSGEATQVSAADPNILQSDNGSTPSSALGQPTPLPASDIDTMMAQLQDMQNNLQTTANLLEQKSQAAGLPPMANTMQSSLSPAEVAALWAEIDQLYQVMQPLMVQLETASANPSTRSASELIALRTKVNTIHQRLGYLLQRVEAAKGQSGMPHSTHAGAGSSQWIYPSGAGTDPAVTNDVTYQQLYQTMTELQTLLQQIESQGVSP
jgi:hypothetical protein